MINRRLLIKNLLAQYDENSFYDKKRQLNLHSKSGKAKFLKHICALSNSNPANNSYLLVGIEDEDDTIIGVDFYDDSKIQNLVNAYLDNPPNITYHNVPFPALPSNKVVGLITIEPNDQITSFKRPIADVISGSIFMRIGSTTVPSEGKTVIVPNNKEIVLSIEKSAVNNLSNTLDSVVDFMTNTHKDLNPKYHVFKEQFILCWAASKKLIRGTPFYSRMDIEFVNEHIKLFYSALDAVTLYYNEDEFIITEYLNLGLNDKTSYYPFEEVAIRFYDNGKYDIESSILFEPPRYNERIVSHIYANSIKIIDKINREEKLSNKEERIVSKLCFNLMLCYLNGFEESKEKLIEIKEYLKAAKDPQLYIGFKEVMRILRKLKYEV